MPGTLLEYVGWDGLAEGNRVALEQTFALEAWRRQHFQADFFFREARVAFQAADQLVVAVNLGQRLSSGLAMEVVDVLRDQKAQHANLLQLGERLMARVRLRHPQRPPKFFVTGLDAVFPALLWVGHEDLKAVHRRLAILGPQAARSPKRRDTAFHRHPRAGQRDRILGA